VRSVSAWHCRGEPGVEAAPRGECDSDRNGAGAAALPSVREAVGAWVGVVDVDDEEGWNTERGGAAAAATGVRACAVCEKACPCIIEGEDEVTTAPVEEAGECDRAPGAAGLLSSGREHAGDLYDALPQSQNVIAPLGTGVITCEKWQRTAQGSQMMNWVVGVEHVWQTKAS